jgi:NAD(P) transhydrogenase
MRYDLVVIGTDPVALDGAIAAARLNKRVALIERNQIGAGGAGLRSNAIPSNAMREAMLHVMDCRQSDALGKPDCAQRQITMQDLKRLVAGIVEREWDVVRGQLDRYGVELHRGDARFTSPHELTVRSDDGSIDLRADYFLLACGARPARKSQIPFDGRRVFDTIDILHLDSIPCSLIVVGAGAIGMECAFMFATLGARVTVVDGREQILEFCDREIVDELMFRGRSLGLVFRLGEDVIGLEHLPGDRVGAQLESGKRLIADSVLYAAGRTGDTAGLNLQAAGLESDESGRLWCDEDHRTWAKHIYGAGDVVGFPALARLSPEQGRRAVTHAFGRTVPDCRLMPCKLNTIPAISMVGKNEEQLRNERVPYEIGMARFDDFARGQTLGESFGLLKLLFHRATRELLGVHCIGEKADELIHIGRSVMSLGGTVEYFRDMEVDDPAVAECCKVAAFDGLNKLGVGGNLRRAHELERAVAAVALELPDAADEKLAV